MAVIERMLDVGRIAERMTPAEVQGWKAEQRSLLTRIAGGADKVQAKLDAAERALARGGQEFHRWAPQLWRYP